MLSDYRENETVESFESMDCERNLTDFITCIFRVSCDLFKLCFKKLQPLVIK